LLEVWNKTSRHLAQLHEVLTFNESYSDYSKFHIDRASYYDDVVNNFVSRQTGFFVPPWTGDYSFAIQADDIGLLYFSNTSSPDNMVTQPNVCLQDCMMNTEYVDTLLFKMFGRVVQSAFGL
jgi:hypothetical protein